MKGNMFTTKKAGLITKLLVCILLAYTVYMLINMQGRICSVNEEVIGLNQQVEAQIQRNAALAEAIENSSDENHKMDVAREKLGLVVPGEKVFEIAD